MHAVSLHPSFCHSGSQQAQQLMSFNALNRAKWIYEVQGYRHEARNKFDRDSRRRR